MVLGVVRAEERGARGMEIEEGVGMEVEGTTGKSEGRLKGEQ